MRMTTRLFATAAILPLALPVAAQVTPEEVWAMMQEVTEVTGAEVTTTQSRDGDTLNIAEFSATWRFPFEAGEISLRAGPYALTEMGDGTVAMDLGETQSVAVAGRLSIDGEEATLTASMDVSQSDAEVIISGTPDDFTMTATSTATTVDLTAIDIDIPDEDIDLSQLQLSSTGGPSSGTTRYVREDDVYRVTSEATAGPSTFSFFLPIEGDATTENNGGSAATSTAASIVLPRGGMSILNLSAAVRAGLAFDVTASVTDQFSNSVSAVGGTVISDQTTATANQTTSMSLGEGGMMFDGTASGVTLNMLMADVIPFPIEMAMAEAEGRIRFPVLASPETPQPVEYDISMGGLTISDQLWGLFDPAEMLPRDPVNLTIDLGAEVRPLVDALDIMTLIGMIDSGETPVELDAVRVDRLAMSAAGAEVEGEGAFTLDFADMVTFPDFPRPEGSAVVRIAGANRLLDTLVMMGLMSEEDVMGARMGMGMFTRVVSDDVVESLLEVDEDAQVFVNGNRIR